MKALRLFLLAVVCASAATAADRELNGRVVDAQSGAPIVRARVTVRLYQGAQPGLDVTLLSDPDGWFRIRNLPEGGYQVDCEKAGYLPLSKGMSPIVSKVGIAEPLVLRLTAQAAIEGTVVDDQGHPVVFASIHLFRQQVVNGRRQFQPAGSDSTDETGYFRAFGLNAGRYYLGVIAVPGGTRRAKSLAYPALFYPNSTELESAQPVDLKAGEEQQIRMKLPEPIHAFEIRGTVASSSSGVGVSLTRQGSGPSPLTGNVETTWDVKTRTFRISHVIPGTYLLTAGIQDGQSRLQGSTTVTVGNADVSGIRLAPAEIVLHGTLRVEGNAVQSLAMGYVLLQSPRGYNNSGTLDADGKFHVTNLLPDTYRVVPQLSSGGCVRAILQGGRDVRDGLIVPLEGTPEPVEIVTGTRCGTVEASMAPSDSAVPPNLTAVLLRKAGDEFVLEKTAFQGIRGADAAPRFWFQSVTPGDYMLYVWPLDLPVEYANAEYMRQFESYGKAVTVTEDGKVTVTLDKALLSVGQN